MRARLFGTLLGLTASLANAISSPVLHFTLARRGGAFPTDNVANLTYLAEELAAAEARFNQTRREIKGNKVVRKPKEKGVGGGSFGLLMGEVGQQGRWYGKLGIGDPAQGVELDLDMLTSDFFVFTTTSSKGSKYDDLWSQSFLKSNEHPYANCKLPTDLVHLPTINTSLPLSFAYCRPSKSYLHTLLASGSMLGLAPSDSLSQTRTPSLLKQLVEKNVVHQSIWSLLLINGQEGVFSVGGTGAEAVETVMRQTKEQMDKFGELEKNKKVVVELEMNKEAVVEEPKLLEKRAVDAGLAAKDDTWRQGWKWSKVQGAEGWWQILMQGVWVDGTKVLKNQPVVIDLNTPFILAPPLAVKAFYSSISGSRPLPPPHNNFYMFPCLNPPMLHFEFGGWNFPAMQGGKGADYLGGPGGKFSLGKVQEGSGYCVGAVVETRMGVEKGGQRMMGKRARGKRVGVGNMAREGLAAGNGMRDVWVLGEGFFRGVGAVFDFEEMRVGLRTY
ncbi:MAG: hypothetical protein M1812_005898 [Candelaria pacifica]|nr:MAG: hypothetical protein M1812_005898 [Candelaria pacifica]